MHFLLTKISRHIKIVTLVNVLLHDGQACSRGVELPNVEVFVVVQHLVHLVRFVALDRALLQNVGDAHLPGRTRTLRHFADHGINVIFVGCGPEKEREEL